MSRTQRVLASISVAGLALLFALTLVISYQFQSVGYYWDQAEHSRGILIAVQNLNRGLMKAESGQRGFLLTSKAGDTSRSPVNRSALSSRRHWNGSALHHHRVFDPAFPYGTAQRHSRFATQRGEACGKGTHAADHY